MGVNEKQGRCSTSSTTDMHTIAAAVPQGGHVRALRGRPAQKVEANGGAGRGSQVSTRHLVARMPGCFPLENRNEGAHRNEGGTYKPRDAGGTREGPGSAHVGSPEQESSVEQAWGKGHISANWRVAALLHKVMGSHFCGGWGWAEGVMGAK